MTRGAQYPNEVSAEGEDSAGRHASVAVIIPCFNDGATLTEAVCSAREQSRLDELIVVNDEKFRLSVTA